MTEASHQMTSNPLPPGTRKPGTVGIAAGPKVAIMDGSGNLLEQGSVGEVVIQGENVTAGYDNNPAANRENFVNGWFRTGDQGIMDEDGYLTITGRLKEIINRGGRKDFTQRSGRNPAGPSCGEPGCHICRTTR